MEESTNINSTNTNNGLKKRSVSLLIGQLMSLCLSGTAIASQFLSDEKYNAPTAQNLPTYLFISIIYGYLYFYKEKSTNNNIPFTNEREGILEILKDRGWKYFLLALIDVEANFAMVYAYQFTNITAIQLLNSFTIPAVMLLSSIFLSARYRRGQFTAVAICLLGLGLTIYTDALHTTKGLNGGTNKFIGDFLCLIGTLLYAISNISEECLVKQHSRSEFLTFIGIFGFLISLIQSYFMDYSKLIKFNWNIFSILILTFFTFSMVLFYSLVSSVMQRSSALLFNIYVLTSDFYSMLAGIFLFGQQFYILYLIAFIIIIFGTILYNREENTIDNNVINISEQEGL